MEALLTTPFAGQPIWMWAAFGTIVLLLLAFDLGVLHKDNHEIGVRESLWLSAGYIAVALVFGGWVWWQLGAEPAMNYYTAFFVEKSLSLDNVFVISLIFTALAVPRVYQHRVLLWGIVGVVVLRAIVIGAGAALVSQFHWVLFIFAAFLVFTGIKMLVMKGTHDVDPEHSPVLKLLRRFVRVTPKLHGQHFWVKLPEREGSTRHVWFATPLLAALVMVESADLVFAVDSVPAVLAITADPFIVYTSNIFAILGLRALYFALAAMIEKFVYLKPALALVLVFIGSKIFVAELWGKVPAALSLGVTIGLLAGGVLASVWKLRREGGHLLDDDASGGTAVSAAAGGVPSTPAPAPRTTRPASPAA